MLPKGDAYRCCFVRLSFLPTYSCLCCFSMSACYNFNETLSKAAVPRPHCVKSGNTETSQKLKSAGRQPAGFKLITVLPVLWCEEITSVIFHKLWPFGLLLIVQSVALFVSANSQQLAARIQQNFRKSICTCYQNV